jgi:chromosome partitioning protein
MHVLALVNQKGGCGKTTTALNLAAALSASGERVLLVDMDPQAHATLGLGCAIEDEPSLIDVLRERVTVAEAVQTAPGGVWLLPATGKLAEFEEEAARMIAPERALARVLAVSRLSYDFAILDCPPRADGVLAANALRAADTAMLVVESGTFALQGALKALDLLGATAATLEEPFCVRAVGTMFDKRLRIARELLVGMHAQLGELLFDTAIRTSVRLREAAAAGLPVNVLDPASRACEDFRALAEEVRRHRTALAEGSPRADAGVGAEERPAGQEASEGMREHWLSPAERRAGPATGIRQARRRTVRRV